MTSEMGTVWAIADLHLSFGTPDKEMDVFGAEWIGWTKKIEENWCAAIHPEDLVLIAGDISWAMRMEQVIPDLQWIDKLPGTKVMIRGNHDYWWESRTKIEKILPPSIKIIQNDAFNWKQCTIGGARLWDTPEFQFGDATAEAAPTNEDTEKIFVRELGRLEMSLKQLNPQAQCRIAMTHYPPLGPGMLSSRASSLLEKYNINICVFGHLHALKQDQIQFGTKNNIHYYLTACDYLDFKPIKIV